MRRIRFGLPALAWWPALRGILITAVATFGGGCGEEPFPLVPVSGKITYADGSLIPGETLVQFIPSDVKTSGKRVAGGASGYLNPQNGTFASLTTHKANDGVAAGRCRVIVVPLPSSGRRAETVRPQYQKPDSTPLKVVVSWSQRYFALTIEKPAGKGSTGR
jgi:hypothetical protein